MLGIKLYVPHRLLFNGGDRSKYAGNGSILHSTYISRLAPICGHATSLCTDFGGEALRAGRVLPRRN